MTTPSKLQGHFRDLCGGDHMVVGLTTTYTITANHH